jgi:hypothetical protein
MFYKHLYIFSLHLSFVHQFRLKISVLLFLTETQLFSIINVQEIYIYKCYYYINSIPEQHDPLLQAEH